MKTIFFFATAFFTTSINRLHAQEKLPVPLNIQQTFIKGTRSTNGKPGIHYWQNTADYTINIDFNPASLLLKGDVHILYTNNSTDTLKEIIFKLYPNLYKKGSPRMVSLEPEDVGEGMLIDKLSSTSNTVEKYTANGTNMTVKISPLSPAHTIDFTIDYHYQLNKGSHFRTGEIEENTAFIAYFFPRIAVYDDIDGWNMNQYLGTQEFYNDFCHFNANITVPKNFVIWATGDLKNSSEVFTEKYCKRISQAEISDTIVNIIDSNDLTNGNITTSSDINKWHFEANNVTDFVFAVSNHYVWKSCSLIVDSTTNRRTRTDAVFNTKHHDFFEVIRYAKETVKAMSFSFPKWPYPYAHITVVDGQDQMEYPMMVNDNPTQTTFDAITLTDHEIFHTMFPFYMGINETKYGWMDEGWATIGEWLISPMIDSTIDDDYGMKRYNDNAGTELDLPVNTLTTQMNGTAMFLNSYVKPALGYLYIKDYLGEELFYQSMHHYIDQWNGKHPMPYDFFNCMNTASGKNMNWFWKKWFFDDGVPDLSLKKVIQKRKKYVATIELKGSKPIPIYLNITYADHSTYSIHRTIEVWEKGNTSVIINIPATKTIKKISLDNTYLPDVNKSDNIWYNVE